MFLWVTSPGEAAYGTGSIVLESPVFYDVSPENQHNKRRLTAHAPNHFFNMSGHLLKNGPNRLPVIRATSGRLFEVQTAGSLQNTNPLVKDANGRQVEVGRIVANESGSHDFFDKAGIPIPHPKAAINYQHNPANVLQEIVSGNTHVFLDINGNEIQVENNQATGDVLMTQTGSIVYYLTMVNDVCAYFLTASKSHNMSGIQFPVSSSERDSICAYARADKKQLPDSNALAIEIKSSWVEAATLPVAERQRYITVNANIPVYKKSDTVWKPIGYTKARMALIGMHIVGTVAGHPEMVWATFEHRSNTPNAAYSYIDVNKNIKTVPQETAISWLLSNRVAAIDTIYNKSHMTGNGHSGIISANAGYIISAGNTLRTRPWGSAPDSATNQQDLNSPASNSEVISLNNAIQSQLIGNDNRKNYLFMGATWTFKGVAPSGKVYGADTTYGVAIGTSALANSTMETYFQGNLPDSSIQTSCFFCHSRSNSNMPGALSHIYDALQPLSKKLELKK